MISLPNVTLIAATSRDYEATAHALESTLARIQPRNTVIFTDDFDRFQRFKAVICNYHDAGVPSDVHFLECPKFGAEFDPAIGQSGDKSFAIWNHTILPGIIADNPDLFAGHILSVHWDGYAVNEAAWSDEFLQYDFVGAPWIQFPEDECVGNDGFCLRSKNWFAAIAALKLPPMPEACHPADAMFCRRVVDARRGWREDLDIAGVKFAPVRLARRFSCEMEPYSGSFGFHGLKALTEVTKAGLTVERGQDGHVPQWRGGLPEALGWPMRAHPDAQSCFDYAELLRTRKEYAQSEVYYRAAIKQDGSAPKLLAMLAEALREQGRYEEAESALLEALSYEPENAETHDRLALLYGMLGDKRADKHFEKALEIWPNMYPAVRNRPFWRLTNGLPITIDEMDWTYQERSRVPRLPWPEWLHKPEPVNKLLVVSDSGAGDTFMMMRWLPDLKERYRVRRIIVEAHETQIPLLIKQPGIDEVIPRHPQHSTPIDVHDWLNITSLAVLGIKPMIAPYIRAKATVPLVGDGLRVGLCWRGSPVNHANERRSAPSTLLRPLAEVPGIDWYSLDFRGDDDPFPLRHYLTPQSTWADTAALIDALDLVVTVDTGVAHLAAAMGKPVQLMLSDPVPGWQWGLSGMVSKWYPSVYIQRQQKRGDWSGLVATIAGRLQADMIAANCLKEMNYARNDGKEANKKARDRAATREKSYA